ncbi:MAG: aminoacyl-tRNA hydrolase [Hyphomonas sp. 32-62-5]|nr:MAG: aminoacyl-tRNA hydrolase [Hyphomonas sp. 32-62-5]
MLILSGQGNPGAKYAKNRHNAGFMVIDRIHEAYGFGPWRTKFDSEISEGTIGGQKVLLMKPQTFYNETGRAASKALIDLAPGRLRVKRGGGHSGNNGARSMMAHIGENFRRIRIGVGHPGDKAMVMPHVLSDFHKVDLEWFNPMTDAICKALPFLLNGEDERFQTEVMRLAPAPKHDPKQTARKGEG